MLTKPAEFFVGWKLQALKIAGVIALVVALGFGVRWVYNSIRMNGKAEGIAEKQAEWDNWTKQQDAARLLKAESDQAAADQKAAEAAKLLSDMAAKNTDLQRRLENEKKNRVYHDCVLPADGLRLWNESARGGESAP
jgi:hypothetical protein